MVPADLPLTSASVTASVGDLARRLGVDPGRITVVLAQAVTWGDRSYGCPQPGVRHVQRPVDGVLVVLAVDGVRYEYHGGDPPTLCTTPRPAPGAARPPRTV